MAKKNKFATNRDIIRAVKRQTKLDEKKITEVFDALFTEIKTYILKNDRVSLSNFGSFEVIKWKSDKLYDINKKAKVEKELKTIKFNASETLKKEVLP